MDNVASVSGPTRRTSAVDQPVNEGLPSSFDGLAGGDWIRFVNQGCPADKALRLAQRHLSILRKRRSGL